MPVLATKKRTPEEEAQYQAELKNRITSMLSLEPGTELSPPAQPAQGSGEVVNAAQVATPTPVLPIAGTAKPAPIPSGMDKPVAKAPPSATSIEAKVEETKQKVAAMATPEVEDQLGKAFKGVPKNDSSRPAKDLAWLEGRYTALDKEYKDKKDSTEWRATIETISNAVTKLFAARAGMQAGVDLSGLQLDKTDFNKELEGVQSDLARRRSQAENLFNESEKGITQSQIQKDKQEAAALARDKLVADKAQQSEENRIAREELAVRKEGSALDRQLRIEKEGEKRGLVAKGRPMNATQLESLSALKEAKLELEDIKDYIARVQPDTGPVADVLNKAARKIGVDSEDATVLRNKLESVLAAKLKAMSGASASEKEAIRLAFTMPRFDQNDQQFMSTLNESLSAMDRAFTNRLDTLSKGGMDISGFSEGTKPAPSSPKAPLTKDEEARRAALRAKAQQK